MKKPRFWLRWLLILGLSGGAALLGFIWWWLPGTHRTGRIITLPTRYDGDRFYVEPITSLGIKLSLLTDTGGGLFLTQGAVERCGLSPNRLLGQKRVRLPRFRFDAWIPEPTGGEHWFPVVDGEGDGMLGQRWFAGGVWTFDYANHKLILQPQPFVPTQAMRQHTVELGFRKEWGMRTANHPHFAVRIDGETVDCLLDTGATVWLSPEALMMVDDSGPSERATSFLAANLYDRWQKAHPQWRVIEKGCQRTGASMIEIPVVEVSQTAIGPVWFTRREEGNFIWMSSFMDKPIRASLGGNALRNFCVTIDYPGAKAYFEKAPAPGDTRTKPVSSEAQPSK
ncbi:MAG TPA: hypothetical protein VN578_09590 [Candidatus Binatia bacterium]|nr:hypothetical protein [Candidatus Binatia bacterium]